MSKFEHYLALWTIVLLVFSYLFNVDSNAVEDEYISRYGNEYNTSGIWHRVRELIAAKGEGIMKNISYHAHKRMYEMDMEVNSAVLDQDTLLFTFINYQNIKVDVIRYYTVKTGDKHPFFLTKGLESGCVFFLTPVYRNTSLQLEFGRHVCNFTTIL